MRARRKTDPLFPIVPINETAVIIPIPPSRGETVIELEALEPPVKRLTRARSGSIDLNSVDVPGPPLEPQATVLVDRYYPLELADAAAAMREARDLDRLLLALAMGTHAFCDHVSIYLHVPAQTALLGQLTLDRGQLDQTRVREQTISLGIPSFVSRLVSRGQIYIGPPPDVGPSVQVLRDTGVLSARDLLVVPVIFEQETFCVILGHSYARALPEKIGQKLARLALEAAVALAHQSTALTLVPAPPPVEPPPPPPRDLPVRWRSADLVAAQPEPAGLGEPAIRALVVQLGDRSPEVRESAARELRPLLGHQPLERILDEVRRGLTAPDPGPRAAAIQRIGQLGDPQAVSPLVVLLGDPDPTVAGRAHRALVTITGQDHGDRESHWERWWRANRHRSRREWLVQGLGHASLPVRITAKHQLEVLDERPLEFDPNAPRKERDARRQSLLERMSFDSWWADNEM